MKWKIRIKVAVITEAAYKRKAAEQWSCSGLVIQYYIYWVQEVIYHVGTWLPGSIARSHTSVTDSISRSWGACKTIVVDPTTHKTQPRIPKICSLSLKIIWARAALQENVTSQNLPIVSKNLKLLCTMPDNNAESTKWSDQYSWSKCISCKIGNLSHNHCWNCWYFRKRLNTWYNGQLVSINCAWKCC